jgi:hypothetical protein
MRAIQIIIIVLAVVLVVLVFFFVRQSITLHRERILSARELWITNFVRRRGPLTQSDVAYVAPWMTFDYVNQLFNVSSSYLHDQLSISDPSYPHVTISGYARYAHMDVGTLLDNVDQALVRHLAPAAPTTTPATSAPSRA